MSFFDEGVADEPGARLRARIQERGGAAGGNASAYTVQHKNLGWGVPPFKILDPGNNNDSSNSILQVSLINGTYVGIGDHT